MFSLKDSSLEKLLSKTRKVKGSVSASLLRRYVVYPMFTLFGSKKDVRQ